MRVCGIIAEYDPFHMGHFHQLNEARRQSQADYVVCVISSAFTQRGMPALFSTQDRARMALSCGADLVLGMPLSYSCAQANRFALGGAGILNALGVVTHLSFGVEAGMLPLLSKASEALKAPTARYRQALREALSRGESLAKAQGEALCALMDDEDAQAFDRPNFNLALAYIGALRSLSSSMEPLPIPRQSDYHDSRASVLPSATAMRGAVLRGAWRAVQGGLPPESYSLVKACAMEGRLHRPQALDSLLLARLQSGGDFSAIDEISEGLDQRILKYAPKAASRAELIALIKTRRYPYARISRALSHCLLGIQKQPEAPPGYARLLGMRKSAAPLLKAIGRGSFPLVTRPAREDHPGLLQDMRAEELWQIGAGQPAARAWQQKIIQI